MDVRDGQSERQAGEQYQPLRCGTGERCLGYHRDISSLVTNDTVPHWQTTITNQDWSGQAKIPAKILSSCLQKVKRQPCKKKYISFDAPLKEKV